uniref:Secreted protein n=1 Tax=Cacopsylla melanoneura TaxID=428564 RepID=A0A8D8QV84_9HEMI
MKMKPTVLLLCVGLVLNAIDCAEENHHHHPTGYTLSRTILPDLPTETMGTPSSTDPDLTKGTMDTLSSTNSQDTTNEIDRQVLQMEIDNTTSPDQNSSVVFPEDGQEPLNVTAPASSVPYSSVFNFTLNRRATQVKVFCLDGHSLDENNDCRPDL